MSMSTGTSFGSPRGDRDQSSCLSRRSSASGFMAATILHLRVGSIRHSIPDDPEDAEAVIGEISSVSGDFNLVLQQGGVVSVKEGGELFATEVVCEVADHEQRRRLFSWDDLNPFSTTTGSTPATGKNGHYYSM